MDSDNDSYHFPKCQTHAHTRFENGCGENSTQNCLQSTLRKKIINTLFAGLGRSVLGKTVTSVLGTALGPRPAASGRTQDLWHSFSQYGPPGRQITYITSKPNDSTVITYNIHTGDTGVSVEIYGCPKQGVKVYTKSKDIT